MERKQSNWIFIGGIVLICAGSLTAQPHDHPADHGKLRTELPPELDEKKIQNFLERNKGKGYSSEKGKDGRTTVKDKNGRVVPLQQILFVPGPPVKLIEKFSMDFIQRNKGEGYTSEKDDQGLTIVKDKKGKVVPFELICQEKLIQNFLDKNKDKGYTSAKDDLGRIIVKDKDGKTVPLDQVLPQPKQTNDGNASESSAQALPETIATLTSPFIPSEALTGTAPTTKATTTSGH